jgi:hypothetical protein
MLVVMAPLIIEVMFSGKLNGIFLKQKNVIYCLNPFAMFHFFTKTKVLVVN